MIHDFFKPASVEEALSLKNTHIESLYLGGGTEINYAGSSQKNECAISLEKLDLNTIRQDGTGLILGASVTLQELIDSSLVPEELQNAARHMYFRNIRNMATLGGNIGANRTDSALIPCLIALAAELHTAEDGRVSVEEYLSGDNQALILSVCIPGLKGKCRVKKISKSSGSPSIVTVAVRIDGSWGKIRDAVIAVGGLAPKVIRLSSIEEELKSGMLTEKDDLQNAISDTVSPQTDVLGSVSYKKYICGVTVADCVSECMEVTL